VPCAQAGLVPVSAWFPNYLTNGAACNFIQISNAKVGKYYHNVPTNWKSTQHINSVMSFESRLAVGNAHVRHSEFVRKKKD